MATVRVELTGVLAGQVLEVDASRMTMGAIEDLQSGNVGLMLTAVAAMVVGGSLAAGVSRDGLRALTPVEFGAVCEGIASALTVPKGR